MTADSRFDVWALRDTQTGFAPGEHFYYSNVGYRTLGYALEAAAGVPYPELLRARILEPMGLEHTEPEITVDIRDRMAVGYDRLHDDRTPSPDDPLFPAPWLETGTADGSLASTAGDLAAFGSALLEGTREDTHLGAATRLRRRVELRLRARAQGRASSVTAARCPASPRRCSATSSRESPSARS